MSKPLCIYHGNCADGFGAAWAVWKAMPDTEFHAGVYQDSPPDVTGRDVIMVDFSYKRSVINNMAVGAKSILILDHHKSAAEDLADLPEPPTGLPDHHGWMPATGVYATFDMSRSGAGITWDHFHGGYTRPMLINYIEDRDLWLFRLEGTRAIQSAVMSHRFDFDVWDGLAKQCEIDPSEMEAEGQAIERRKAMDIEALANGARPLVIGGHQVPAVNAPGFFASELGHKLSEIVPFAVVYFDMPDGRVFSLRSRDDGADVSEIAKQYGGGGHEHAAGFRVPLSEIGQFEL